MNNIAKALVGRKLCSDGRIFGESGEGLSFIFISLQAMLGA